MADLRMQRQTAMKDVFLKEYEDKEEVNFVYP
jgi:hypothetical protein